MDLACQLAFFKSEQGKIYTFGDGRPQLADTPAGRPHVTATLQLADVPAGRFQVIASPSFGRPQAIARPQLADDPAGRPQVIATPQLADPKKL